MSDLSVVSLLPPSLDQSINKNANNLKSAYGGILKRMLVGHVLCPGPSRHWSILCASTFCVSI